MCLFKGRACVFIAKSYERDNSTEKWKNKNILQTKKKTPDSIERFTFIISKMRISKINFTGFVDYCC